jgi:cytochrome c553
MSRSARSLHVGCLLVALALPGVAATVGRNTRNVKPAAGPAAVSPLQSARIGDAEAGKDKADNERCIECHGPQGHGAGHSNGPEGKFPKLAGQRPAYLAKQLLNFRSGERKHDTMNMMARSVSEEDLLDIVAFFSSQSPMLGDGKGDNPVGRSLFAQGDAARNVTACITCHGEADTGALPAGVAVPIIRGQEWRYLEQQLLDWRSGWRNNSVGGVMNRSTQALTDKEIADLASYLSSLR